MTALRDAVLAALPPGPDLAARLSAGDDSVLVELSALPRPERLLALLSAAARPFTWQQRARFAGLGRPTVDARAAVEGALEDAPLGADGRALARWAGLPWGFPEDVELLDRLAELDACSLPLSTSEAARLELEAPEALRDAVALVWAESGGVDGTSAALDRVEAMALPHRFTAQGATIARGTSVPADRLARWAAQATSWRGELAPTAEVHRFAILAAAGHFDADAAFERCLRQLLTAPPDVQGHTLEVLASALAALRLSVAFERLSRSLVLRPPMRTTQVERLVSMASSLTRFRGGAAEAAYAALRQLLPHARERAGHAVVHAAGLYALSHTPGRSLEVAWSALEAELRGLQMTGAWAIAIQLVVETDVDRAASLLMRVPAADRPWVAFTMAPWTAPRRLVQ